MVLLRGGHHGSQRSGKRFLRPIAQSEACRLPLCNREITMILDEYRRVKAGQNAKKTSTKMLIGRSHRVLEPSLDGAS